MRVTAATSSPLGSVMRPPDRERVRELLARKGVYLDEGPYPPELTVPPAIAAMDFGLPFPKGTRVLAGQGHNSMVARATHRPGNLRYSIDFAAAIPGLPVDGAHYPAAFVRGTPILAVAAGTAYVYGGAREQQGDNWGYGNIVLVDHGNGYASLYAHVQDMTVTTGQKIPAGFRIASLGATGNAFHPHLHFQMVHLTRVPNPAAEAHRYSGKFPALPPWESPGVPFIVRVNDRTTGLSGRVRSFDIHNAEYGELWDMAHLYEV